MKKGYQKEITVSPADLDELNHVNNIQYVHWIQEISREHWTGIAPREFREKYIWVVRRHEIDYRNPAVLNDRIQIYTFIEQSRGPLSTRIVEMSVLGTPLIHARTQWCLLNASTLRPQRVPEEIAKLFA